MHHHYLKSRVNHQKCEVRCQPHATEFFREINRKFENGRTASLTPSNGNGSGDDNKGNNGRIGGVRPYSLVNHTCMFINTITLQVN